MKPVRRERLERALEQAARISGNALQQLSADQKMQSQRQHVCTREHGQLRLIPITDIRYFNADQKYVTVHHSDGQSLIDDSLKQLEEEFAGRFVRIHRNSLVAVKHIDRLEKTEDGKSIVVLRNSSPDEGDMLTISRRHLADVRRQLKGR